MQGHDRGVARHGGSNAQKYVGVSPRPLFLREDLREGLCLQACNQNSLKSCNGSLHDEVMQQHRCTTDPKMFALTHNAKAAFHPLPCTRNGRCRRGMAPRTEWLGSNASVFAGNRSGRNAVARGRQTPVTLHTAPWTSFFAVYSPDPRPPRRPLVHSPSRARYSRETSHKRVSMEKLCSTAVDSSSQVQGSSLKSQEPI